MAAEAGCLRLNWHDVFSELAQNTPHFLPSTNKQAFAQDVCQRAKEKHGASSGLQNASPGEELCGIATALYLARLSALHTPSLLEHLPSRSLSTKLDCVSLQHGGLKAARLLTRGLGSKREYSRRPNRSCKSYHLEDKQCRLHHILLVKSQSQANLNSVRWRMVCKCREGKN